MDVLVKQPFPILRLGIIQPKQRFFLVDGSRFQARVVGKVAVLSRQFPQHRWQHHSYTLAVHPP